MTSLPRSRSQRYLAEILFSFSSGLLLEWLQQATSLSPWNLRVQLWIARHLRFLPPHDVSSKVEFLDQAVAFSLCVFLVVRLLSIKAITARLSSKALAVISAVLFPACWLYVTHLSPQLPGLANPPRSLLLLEIAAVLLCSFTFLSSRRQMPTWAGVAIFLLHFSFWTWLFLGGPYFWRDPFKLMFPLTGLLSSLAWMFYFRGGTTQNRSQLAVS